MSMVLHDTTNWSYDRFDWPNIVACLKRWADRFPDDTTVESALKDVMRGALRLWVVQNGQRTVLVVLTQAETVEATGRRKVTINGFAGDGGLEALPLLSQIEACARAEGADIVEVVGRRGWIKALNPLGYQEAAVVLRKVLT